MKADWRTFCKGQRLVVEGNVVSVEFDNGRHHRVRIEETDETFELHAVVARAAVTRAVTELPLRIWRHNRAAQLVGFQQDSRGAVWAGGWVAKAGLSREEFLTVLRRVAAESDRLEFLLTGRDAE